MSAPSKNPGIITGLLVAVVLWGANNTGTKEIVSVWPPAWTGSSRFICAGFLFLLLLRHTKWFGETHPLSRAVRKNLWWRGGASLAVYIMVFNTALRHTPASHVALYLAASPVWALLWERHPLNRLTLWRFAAAGVALAGVMVLFWPALERGAHNANWLGEALGLLTGILWTHYGRQCRALGASMSGAEVSAHTLWRAGILLLPFALVEIWRAPLQWPTHVVLTQLYCILGGGIAAFAIWTNALRHWPASRVLLFNNLIPLSTMGWSYFCLGEQVTRTFWLAMLLVMLGVVAGQPEWLRRSSRENPI